MRNYLIAAAFVVGSATAAQATVLDAGTAGIGITTGIVADTSVNPGIFSATSSFVTVSNTTGSFTTPDVAPFPFSFGTLNGDISFSKSVGSSIFENVADFLTFGGISFSVSKVTTVSYSVNPGVSTSVSLYLLGTAIKAGFEATATSLTLQFNNTNNSAFSGSATLATPPAPPPPSVPEPATWGLMLVGFGAMGAAMRRRKVNLTFA
jgi:hypothetical protein